MKVRALSLLVATAACGHADPPGPTPLPRDAAPIASRDPAPDTRAVDEVAQIQARYAGIDHWVATLKEEDIAGDARVGHLGKLWFARPSRLRIDVTGAGAALGSSTIATGNDLWGIDRDNRTLTHFRQHPDLFLATVDALFGGGDLAKTFALSAASTSLRLTPLVRDDTIDHLEVVADPNDRHVVDLVVFDRYGTSTDYQLGPPDGSAAFPDFDPQDPEFRDYRRTD